MRILDADNNEITSPDLDKGHLEIEEIVIKHHDAVPASAGKSHIEVLKEYSNGGKDVATIWDEKPVEAKPAWDETEQIQRYVLYTDDELKERAEQAEDERQASLIPTNDDLTEASLDLASNIADNESVIAELGEYIASLEERIAKLEG